MSLQKCSQILTTTTNLASHVVHVHLNGFVRKQVNRNILHVHVPRIFPVLIITYSKAINGRKKTIQQYAAAITSNIQDVDDPNTLDRVLALLTQASASLTAAAEACSDNKQVNTFVKKDHFAPTQKNETQLRFKRTTKPPGRKKQYIPLR